jgi:hypothetical protein
MLKIRNLVAVGITLALMMVVMIPLTAAQPLAQVTETPAATTEPTVTTGATLTATAEASPTSQAPTVSPLTTPEATAISTPSTLPTTGGGDDGTAMMGLIALVLGILILFGAFGLALSRRSHPTR